METRPLFIDDFEPIEPCRLTYNLFTDFTTELADDFLNWIFEVEEYNGNYGDWGRPLEFVSCSAVFNLEVQKKCILIRFENGYLAIVFSAGKKGPEADEIENRLFFYEQRDGVNSVAEKNGETILCNLRAISDAAFYYDLDGNIVAGVSVLEQKTYGWQVDENRKYATFYKTYSGSIVENVVKIFYKDEVVLVLEGRF